MPDVPESKWVELLSLNARKIFGLDYRVIQKDFPASVTIYQPSEQIEVNETFFRSRSRNSPFIGKKLKGKVLGIVNGEKVFLK
jgi:dihydroorotase